MSAIDGLRFISRPACELLPMFEQFRAAIAGARFPQIESVSRDIWRAHGAGLLPDHDAQSLAEALQARRRALATHVAPSSVRLTSDSLCRSVPRSPDRERSIMRRRSVAACGAVPSTIAARFTLCEVAVLSVIAGEVKRRGVCELPIDAVAAMAGTSRSVVKRALRSAAAAGLVTVRERRRAGLKSLTNVVAIVSNEWRAWLRLADRGPKKNHHEYQLFNTASPGQTLSVSVKGGHRSSTLTLKQGLFDEASRISSPS